MRILPFLAAAALILLWLAPETSTAPTAPASVPRARAAAADGLAGVRFVPNQGQWHAEVRYAVLGSTAAWIHDDGFTVRFARHEQRAHAHEMRTKGLPQTSGAVMRTRFSGAAASSVVGERVAGALNFLCGDDPASWRTAVPSYAGVTMRRVLPGIDVVYRPMADARYAFAYDLALAPGADLSAFAATCEGAQELALDRDGRLRVAVRTPDGVIELTQEPPVAWQETQSGRRPIEVEFRLLGPRTYGFAAIDLDVALPTVIDPGVAWSTFVGGGSSDSVNDLVWRPGSGIWLTGWTGSIDFPTTTGAYQTTGQRDAFVAKLDENGDSLHWAMYFGGSTFDEARGLDLGPGLTPTIVGQTDSVDLPITANAYQASYGGASPIVPLGDAFVARLSANGDTLLASTYLGGAYDEMASAVAVDAQGHAHVAGWSSSGNFPTTPNAWQPAIGGPLTLQSDGFLARLAPDLQTASYATYFGGTLPDQFLDIDLDPVSGDVVAVGWSGSFDFPTTSLAYRTSSSGSLDMVIVRFAASGSGPVYSSFLGGVSDEYALGLDLAADGSVWLGGWTVSSNFPVTVGAPQTTQAGQKDGVVCHLSSDGQTLIYSTLLGGGGADQVRDIAVDGSDVLIVGEAGAGFPLTLDAAQPTFGGGELDAFAAWLGNSGATLDYSSFVGGTGQDVFGCLVYQNGLGVFGGSSFSADFPVTAGALQTQSLGIEDGVVMMLDLLTDLPGGLTVSANPPKRHLTAGGEHEILQAVVTNSSSRELIIEAVRVLVAGSGFAPVQARDLEIWLDDPATQDERDRLVGGPMSIAADDVETEVALQDLRIPAGASATMRVVVDFAADVSGGTVELACAIVDNDAWTVRAFGAGAGPTARVLGNGRAEGPILVAGALPGDNDGDTGSTVLDLRGMCSRLAAVDPLVDADGDQVISLADVDLTRAALLGRSTVIAVPAIAPRGSWITVRGVFPVAGTVEAVLGGRALKIGCLSARELTLFVDPMQSTGTVDLTIAIDGRTVAAQTVLVQ